MNSSSWRNSQLPVHSYQQREPYPYNDVNIGAESSRTSSQPPYSSQGQGTWYSPPAPPQNGYYRNNTDRHHWQAGQRPSGRALTNIRASTSSGTSSVSTVSGSSSNTNASSQGSVGAVANRYVGRAAMRPDATASEPATPRAAPLSITPASSAYTAPGTIYGGGAARTAVEARPDEASSVVLNSSVHRTDSSSRQLAPASSGRRRRNHREQRNVQTYTLQPIHMPPSAVSAPPRRSSTLTTDEYNSLFKKLYKIFCVVSYQWLALHAFQIPYRQSTREHCAPEDRELTDYVAIIKSLVVNRRVGRDAVQGGRVEELISVMDGAAEIRHVATHVSREFKPDRRVLGFISSVEDFCWLLNDDQNTANVFSLYEYMDKLMAERSNNGRF